MRDVVYYIACTLDGFIARDDGSFAGFPWDDQFGADLLATFPETFPAHLRGGEWTAADNKRFDTVLMGRRTYEVGLREGITCPYPTLQQYVFSHTMSESPDERVVLVSSNAVERVRKLKEEAGRAIWLCGGGVLASTLLAAGLIEKLIVKLNPVLFGSGIPLFSGGSGQKTLTLTGSRTYDSGHVLLHYSIAS